MLKSFYFFRFENHLLISVRSLVSRFSIFGFELWLFPSLFPPLVTGIHVFISDFFLLTDYINLNAFVVAISHSRSQRDVDLVLELEFFGGMTAHTQAHVTQLNAFNENWFLSLLSVHFHLQVTCSSHLTLRFGFHFFSLTVNKWRKKVKFNQIQSFDKLHNGMKRWIV